MGTQVGIPKGTPAVSPVGTPVGTPVDTTIGRITSSADLLSASNVVERYHTKCHCYNPTFQVSEEAWCKVGGKAD